MKKRDPEDYWLEFRELYVTFASQMATAYQERRATLSTQFLVKKRFNFKDSTWTMVDAEALDYRSLIPSPDDTDFPRLSADKCARVIYKNRDRSEWKMSTADGQPITNPSFKQIGSHIVLDYLLKPIHYTIKNSKYYSPSGHDFVKGIDLYLLSWKHGHVLDRRFAAIDNFRTDIGKISISDQVSIVPFQPKLKNSIYNSDQLHRRPLSPDELAKAEHVVMFRGHPWEIDPGVKKEEDLKAIENLKCAITALRLIKPKNVGSAGVFTLPIIDKTVWSPFSRLPDYAARDYEWWEETYELERNNLPEFHRIIRQLSKENFKVWNNLSLPILQFNRSCQRARNEDRVIDYAICLESSLLHDQNDELSYRLSQRAAVLCRNEWDAAQIFKAIKTLYEIRSKIVHNNKQYEAGWIYKLINNRGIDTKDYLSLIDEIVRYILKELIKRTSVSGSIKVVCKELESEVLALLSR